MALNPKTKDRLVLEAAVMGLTDSEQAPKKRGGRMFNAFPLMAVPWAVYNILVIVTMVGSGSADAAYNMMTGEWFSVPMPGPGAIWHVSLGDVILFIGMFCLFFELVKSTSSDNVAILNHSLSLILFIICLVEFLLLRSFATSTFFFLMMMCLLDVVAGFIVTAIAARKDIGME